MATGTQNELYGNPNFRPIKVRDSLQFVRGNTSAFSHEGGENGVATVVGPNSTPGAHPNAPFAVGAYTAFSAAYVPGNIRSIDAEILFNYPVYDERLGGGGVSIQTNPFPLGAPTNAAAASIASVRGAIIIGGTYTSTSDSSGKTGTAKVDPSVTVATSIIKGYLYGVQGKIVVRGTLATTNGEYSAALQGQLDLSAAVAVTSPLSALWLDLGATASAAVISAPTQVNAINITNTTAAVIHSALSFNGNAMNLFDVNDLAAGGQHFFQHTGAGLGTITTSYLVVVVNGATYHLPLYQ
jgi:hypothetical protein